MRKLFISLAALSLLSAGAVEVTKQPLKSKAAKPANVSIKRASLPSFQSSVSSLNADFTVEGADALAPVVSFNFDKDMEGWTADPTQNVTWSIKSDASFGEGKGFSSIEPASEGSLFVEGPYQIFKREISSVTSPDMMIPANANLSFYIRFSLNYDDVCRMLLSVSTDDFETSTVLWNSKDAEGEKPTQWRYVSLPLDEYVGKNVKFRLTYSYGSGDEMFKTGGYMGDFAIDGFTISGRKTVDSIDVITGDVISFVDMSEGEIDQWEWSFPGGVPESATVKNPSVYYTKDGNYDISLTVKDKEGNISTKTRSDFVHVTGTAPVSQILPPATFRLSSNRKHLVAPLSPVTFRDASAGFPTEYTWGFMGVTEDPNEIFTTTEAEPTVSYAYLHDHKATLIVQNEHGISQSECEVTAEYSGVVNNLRPTDTASVFDMEDWGVFPGSNTRKITAYAERFSAPSVPSKILGAYVFFNEASAGDLVDQISNVGVHLYTSKDGKPDKRLDSWWWSVYELDLPSGGQAVGTSFPFTEAPVVSDEFFIVVDGIPEYKEAKPGSDTEEATSATKVSFGMADFRADGGTALMLKDGEWIEVADYFPAGKNHTSFMIYPEIAHSVMTHLSPEDGVAKVGGAAGETEFEIFSYMGYETPETDSDWLRVVSEPNGMTVDKIRVEYDAYPENATREGNIYLTDGATKLKLTVHQDGEESAIINFEADSEENIEYFNLQGLRILNPQPGQIVIKKSSNSSSKIKF